MHRAVADLGLPLVQFAVRDMSREEAEVRKRYNVTHYDAYFLARVGLPEQPLPEDFPRRIYISFDVDGLDSSLMPATARRRRAAFPGAKPSSFWSAARGTVKSWAWTWWTGSHSGPAPRKLHRR